MHSSIKFFSNIIKSTLKSTWNREGNIAFYTVTVASNKKLIGKQVSFLDQRQIR